MTKQTPYDRLGVPKTATQAEIKRAYRKRASKTHPDRGGNPVEFAAIHSAFILLSDPNKRQQYDATGDESAIPDNITSKAVNNLAGMFQQLLNQIQDEPNCTTTDWIITLRRSIETTIHKNSDAVKMLNKRLNNLKKLEHRFIFRGPEKQSLVHNIWLEQCRQTELAIHTGKTEVLIGEKMLELLQNYQFKKDTPRDSRSSYFDTDITTSSVFNTRW